MKVGIFIVLDSFLRTHGAVIENIQDENDVEPTCFGFLPKVKVSLPTSRLRWPEKLNVSKSKNVHINGTAENQSMSLRRRLYHKLFARSKAKDACPAKTHKSSERPAKSKHFSSLKPPNLQYLRQAVVQFKESLRSRRRNNHKGAQESAVIHTPQNTSQQVHGESQPISEPLQSSSSSMEGLHFTDNHNADDIPSDHTSGTKEDTEQVLLAQRSRCNQEIMSIALTDEPLPSFICPFTKSVMNEPVVDLRGNSFEKSALQKHGSPDSRFFQNRTLEALISLWRDERSRWRQSMMKCHLPDPFLDSITATILSKPQITSDGNTYSGDTMDGIFQHHQSKDPMTRNRINHLSMAPNKNVHNAMVEFYVVAFSLASAKFLPDSQLASAVGHAVSLESDDISVAIAKNLLPRLMEIDSTLCEKILWQAIICDDADQNRADVDVDRIVRPLIDAGVPVSSDVWDAVVSSEHPQLPVLKCLALSKGSIDTAGLLVALDHGDADFLCDLVTVVQDDAVISEVLKQRPYRDSMHCLVDHLETVEEQTVLNAARNKSNKFFRKLLHRRLDSGSALTSSFLLKLLFAIHKRDFKLAELQQFAYPQQNEDLAFILSLVSEVGILDTLTCEYVADNYSVQVSQQVLLKRAELLRSCDSREPVVTDRLLLKWAANWNLTELMVFVAKTWPALMSNGIIVETIDNEQIGMIQAALASRAECFPISASMWRRALVVKSESGLDKPMLDVFLKHVQAKCTQSVQIIQRAFELATGLELDHNSLVRDSFEEVGYKPVLDVYM